VLEAIEEALDAVAQRVFGLSTGRFCRDHRVCAAPLEIVANGVAVIPLVGQHRGRIGRLLLHQILVGGHIRGLAGRQAEADGEALRIRSSWTAQMLRVFL
jgi:hypothetical protein